MLSSPWRNILHVYQEVLCVLTRSSRPQRSQVIPFLSNNLSLGETLLGYKRRTRSIALKTTRRLFHTRLHSDWAAPLGDVCFPGTSRQRLIHRAGACVISTTSPRPSRIRFLYYRHTIKYISLTLAKWSRFHSLIRCENSNAIFVALPANPSRSSSCSLSTDEWRSREIQQTHEIISRQDVDSGDTCCVFVLVNHIVATESHIQHHR